MRSVTVVTSLFLCLSAIGCASVPAGGETGTPSTATFDQQDPLYRMLIERSREQFRKAGAPVTPESWNLLEARIRRATVMLRQEGAPPAEVVRATEDIAVFVDWMIHPTMNDDHPLVSAASFYAALRRCNPNDPNYPGCP